jgi:hypothetical protein
MSKGTTPMSHRIYGMAMKGLYPAYIAKAEKKGRSKGEVNSVICWLTGHSEPSLEAVLATPLTVAEFFAAAPRMNPARDLVTGKVCGVLVEAVDDPLMREIRRLDKMIDELAKGRPMEKILRA